MGVREFQDLGEFALHLAALEMQVAKAEQAGLEKAARLVEARAKAKIGHYQEASGPFQDWEQLSDSTEAEKSRLGYPLDAPLLRKGDLRESVEHEVSGSETVIGSKSDIAAYQEFGTPSIPPRPFIGPAAFELQDKIAEILGAAVVEGITGGVKIHESLGYDIEVKP